MKHQHLPFETIQHNTQFYFLRHGESEGNKNNIVQGRKNALLTQKGREQAEQAGKFLAHKHIDRVYSSPLSRAKETAEIASQGIGIEQSLIILRDDLMELNTGIFSGLSLEQAQEQYPAAWKGFQQNSWEGVPEAESIASLLARATSMWLSLIEDAKQYRNILCVSHGGTLNWLIKRSMSAQWSRWVPVIRTGNCCLHCLSIYPSKSIAGSYYAEWTLLNYAPPFE